MHSNFTKLDMHTHSEYSSDSRLSLEKIGDFLRRSPDFGLVISDHNEIAGALELQTGFPDRIISAEEIKTDSGEVTGLFLKERIPPKKSITWTMDAIIAQGGLVYVPHPADRLRTSRLRPEALKEAVRRADIIEVFNSRNVFGSDDKKALRMAEENGTLMGCGSDAHTFWELGNSYVEFMEPFELTAGGLLEALGNAVPSMRRTFLGVHVLTKAGKIKRKHFNRGKL